MSNEVDLIFTYQDMCNEAEGVGLMVELEVSAIAVRTPNDPTYSRFSTVEGAHGYVLGYTQGVKENKD